MPILRGVRVRRDGTATKYAGANEKIQPAGQTAHCAHVDAPADTHWNAALLIPELKNCHSKLTFWRVNLLSLSIRCDNLAG